MYERSFYVEAGGLMSYATSDDEIFRRAAVYVDKILRVPSPRTYLLSNQRNLNL